MNIRETLLQDIADLGLPGIIDHRHGLTLKVDPDGYEVESGEIAFTLAGQRVAIVSTLGEVELWPDRCPANLIITCAKCYRVRQRNYGDTVAFLFWQAK